MNKRISLLIPPNTQNKLQKIREKHQLNQSQTIRLGIDLAYQQLIEETQ